MPPKVTVDKSVRARLCLTVSEECFSGQLSEGNYCQIWFMSVIRWQNRNCLNAGLRFAFVFAKFCGKQESPSTFILSNQKGKKEQEIP